MIFFLCTFCLVVLIHCTVALHMFVFGDLIKVGRTPKEGYNFWPFEQMIDEVLFWHSYQNLTKSSEIPQMILLNSDKNGISGGFVRNQLENIIFLPLVLSYKILSPSLVMMWCEKCVVDWMYFPRTFFALFSDEKIIFWCQDTFVNMCLKKIDCLSSKKYNVCH